MKTLSSRLAAPCIFCDYNGQGYWRADTHDKTCPWRSVGGLGERKDRFAKIVSVATGRLAASEAKLQDSEAMRKRLRSETVYLHDRLDGHQHPLSCNCGTAASLRADYALGYSDDAGEQGGDAAHGPGCECGDCSTVPLSPGDAAAAEEHAANSEPAILGEQIDTLLDAVNTLQIEVGELQSGDGVRVLAGRIDACTEAISDIRRRLDEPGESVEDEARWYFEQMAKMDWDEWEKCAEAVTKGLTAARAAVRKERER